MNNEPDYDNLYFERTNTMTQKIFDTDNAEDMALLWSILPDEAYSIKNLWVAKLGEEKERILDIILSL